MSKTTFIGYVPSLKLKGAEATIVEGKAIESKGGSIRYTLRGEYKGRKTLPKTVSKADFEGVYGFDAKEAEAVIMTGELESQKGKVNAFHKVGEKDKFGFTPETIVPVEKEDDLLEAFRENAVAPDGTKIKDLKDADTVGSPSPASVEPSAPSEDPFPQEPSNASFSAECGDGGQNPCKECGGHPCPRCNAPHPSSHDSIETKDGDVCLPCATDAETRENYFWNDLLGGYMTREEMLEQYPERKDEIDNSRNPEMREDYQPYQESYQPKEIDIEEIERLGMEKDEREIKKLMDEKGLTYEEARQMKMDNAIDQIPHWESNEVKEAFGFGKEDEEEEAEPKEQEFTVVLQEGDKLELTDIEEQEETEEETEEVSEEKEEGDDTADEPKEEDSPEESENEEKEAEDDWGGGQYAPRTFLVTAIDYDIDGREQQAYELEDGGWLPQELTFTVVDERRDKDEDEINDILADKISDKTDFLVNGFLVKEQYKFDTPLKNNYYVDFDAESYQAVSAKVTRPVKEEEKEEEETEDGEGMSTLMKVGLGVGALAVGAAILGAEGEYSCPHCSNRLSRLDLTETYTCPDCDGLIYEDFRDGDGDPADFMAEDEGESDYWAGENVDWRAENVGTFSASGEVNVGQKKIQSRKDYDIENEYDTALEVGDIDLDDYENELENQFNDDLVDAIRESVDDSMIITDGDTGSGSIDVNTDIDITVPVSGEVDFNWTSNEESEDEDVDNEWDAESYSADGLKAFAKKIETEKEEDLITCGGCGGEYEDEDRFTTCGLCGKDSCDNCGDSQGPCNECGVMFCYACSGCGDCGYVCENCECDCNSKDAESDSKNLKMALGITALGIGLAAILGKDKLKALFDRFGL